jgi:hypothetical protein
MTERDTTAIGNKWALVLQGTEGLIVRPYLVEDTGDRFELQYVYGSGGSLVTGDSYSLHDTLEGAIRALGAARVTILVHSEGELAITTDGFRS